MGGNGRGDLAEHMLEPCQGDGYNSDHGVKVYITLLNRQCQGSDGLAPVFFFYLALSVALVFAQSVDLYSYKTVGTQQYNGA